MEGLTVAKSLLTAYLHPSRADDVQQGVLQLLNSLLLRYNEEFDGVVLAYLDIKICNWTAKILSGQFPYLSLKLKAKLLLFSPKPGMLLEGEVNKVEKDYIGVIVLGIFNAVIAFEDIREEFCYQDNVPGTPLWVSTSSGHVITLGSKIKFTVKSVQGESFLDISGSLKISNTGCIDRPLSPLEKKPTILEVERKMHKKERKRDVVKENKDVEFKDADSFTEVFPADTFREREHKHKSKRKRNDTDIDIKDGAVVKEESPVVHTQERGDKHRSKRNKSDRGFEHLDGDKTSKELSADYFEYKQKEKRKISYIDANV